MPEYLEVGGVRFIDGHQDQDGIVTDRHEPDLAPYFTGSKGFLDIGAHYGKYAVKFASQFEHVIAFEPIAENAQRLKENLELNEITNVEVIETAPSRLSRANPSH